MRERNRIFVWIVLLILFSTLLTLSADFIERTGVFYETSGFNGFHCYEHNYTQTWMEPNVRYVCFENQTCYSYVLPNGTGVFIMLEECIVSYYVESDNRTVKCAAPPDECDRAYALKGEEVSE